MGPLPKRRKSRARQGNRESKNTVLTPTALGVCPQCHSPVLPHHACLTCGTYAGREVIKIKEKKKAAG